MLEASVAYLPAFNSVLQLNRHNSCISGECIKKCIIMDSLFDHSLRCIKHAGKLYTFITNNISISVLSKSSSIQG